MATISRQMAASHGVSVSGASRRVHGATGAIASQGGRAPGSIVHYTLQLTNNGLVPDTFTVGLSGNQWIVTAPTIIGPVNPGATTNVPVTVYVSFFAPNGAADTTQVAISSQGDTSEKITATLTTSVEVIGELYLTLLPQIVK